jgi:hypothetical protein
MPFAVIRECGVSEGSRGWAETDGPTPVAHATRAGAGRAAAALVPAGKDPWTYAGLKVRRVRPDNGLMILDD